MVRRRVAVIGRAGYLGVIPEADVWSSRRPAPRR
jgi:hypothetical protein